MSSSVNTTVTAGNTEDVCELSGSAGSSDGGQNRTGRTADEEENRTGPVSTLV